MTKTMMLAAAALMMLGAAGGCSKAKVAKEIAETVAKHSDDAAHVGVDAGAAALHGARAGYVYKRHQDAQNQPSQERFGVQGETSHCALARPRA